ncbi:hypothetical protein NQ318_002191 [Aromia moschata]|uniref:Peptidoglycan-recognition protein n=1 Tax=Aromia moschata TaxID=1265417 RepID=A0AAV8Z5A9_9CUCU|nr:hypothetical protein NQ318_002191 [Aromia moschata]
MYLKIMDPVIVSRSEWNAKPAKAVEEMTNPVPYVVIHHSYTPLACNTSEECVQAMHWMQDFHQDVRKWWDIGYHFAAGGDGRIYEGRGWSRVGAHAPHYNNISIGICVIGDWTSNLPPETQLGEVKKFIAMGVREGKIMEDYKLAGQEGTDCPGDALYNEIKTWPHYYTTPDYTVYRRLAEPSSTVPPYESNKLKKRHLDAEG